MSEATIETSPTPSFKDLPGMLSQSSPRRCGIAAQIAGL
jgi:hypothetical protein